MIKIYTKKHGAYYCEAQFKDYGINCRNKVVQLLEDYKPQDIIISKGDDIIKKQFEGLEDGV